MEMDNLKQALTESWVRIEFTKVNGSNRKMLCTRNFVDIPVVQHPSGTKKENKDELLTVFDLDKQAWRSIKTNNIIAWNVEERS